jgi:HPt (histidine-containing phosphotransfer) domain-containing protein
MMTADNDLIIPQEARLKYIERRKKDIESLKAALEIRNYEEFKRIGHQLKGNAASFGYADLEKISVQMEQAGDKRDHLEASRQLEAFEQWFSKESAASGIVANT